MKNDIDKLIQDIFNFQGQVNAMANSLEIILDKIIEDKGIKWKKV